MFRKLIIPAAAAAITLTGAGSAMLAGQHAAIASHRPAECRAHSFLTDGKHSLYYYGHLQPGVTDQTLLYWADKCSRSGFWPFRLGLYMDRGNMHAPLPRHLRLWVIVFSWWPPAGR